MKKKILVVDDDFDILEPLTLLIEGEGYIVESTPKGEEVYRLVDIFQPDLILLDILLSGSDGRAICKKLKNDKNTAQIPLVMMSAHPTAKNDAVLSGADDFLAKPFETDALYKIIKKNLK